MDDDLFSITLACRLKHKLDPDDAITAVGGSPSNVFLGTAMGSIFHLKSSNGSLSLFRTVNLNTKTRVRKIVYGSALNLLLILCESELFEIDEDDFKMISSLRNITDFCTNDNPTSDDPLSLEVAVASTSKQIRVGLVRGNKLELSQKITTNSPVVAMAYSRNIVCYATASEYFMYDCAKKLAIPLFTFDRNLLPSITYIDKGDFLLSGVDGLLVFVNENGQSLRAPLLIPAAVDSFAFHAPFTYVLTHTEVHVIDIENQDKIRRKSVQSCSALTILDGDIFMICDNDLVQLKQLHFSEQMEKLIEQEKFDAALEMSLLELERHGIDAEDFANIRKRLAILLLERNQFEKAADLLSDFDVLSQVIPMFLTDDSSFRSQECRELFKKLLLNAREGVIDETEKQMVDNTLLYILEGDDFASFVTREPLFVDEDKLLTVLKAKQMHSTIAERKFRHGHYKEAIALWKSMADGTLSDPEFLLNDVVGKLSIIPADNDFMSCLRWLFNYEPRSCVEAALARKSLLFEDVYDIIKPQPEMCRLFLTDCEPNSRVAFEQSKFLIEDVRNGEQRKRGTLRQALLSLDAGYTEELLKSMEPDLFEVERILLRSNESPVSSLTVVLERFHDFEAAELLCSQNADSHPELSAILLQYYLQHRSGDSRMEARIVQLLNGSNYALNGKDVLDKIPQNLPVREISSFLKRTISNEMEVLKMQLLRQSLLDRLVLMPNDVPNKSVSLNEDSRCEVCKDALSYDEPLMMLRCGVTVHSRCTKSPNVMPFMQ